MKTQFFLPLATYPDQNSESMISNAVDFARNQEAILHASAIDIVMPPISNPWATLLIDTDKMVVEAETASQKHGERQLKILGNRCAAAGVTLVSEAVYAEQPMSADVTAEIARPYDLVLLEAGQQFRATSEAVVFGSGRPVVVFPDQPASGRIGHIAIAWDGSRSAARALGDAMAFIRTASEISIVSVMDEKPVEEDIGRRIFDSLAARGFKAQAYPVHLHNRPIGEALQSKAFEIGADLLVMGAFGHSRLREFVLGGATRQVLSEPRLPVLMSH